MVWEGISISDYTDAMVDLWVALSAATVAACVPWKNSDWCEISDEILESYVHQYAGAIGSDFILMDDDAQPHRSEVVEVYLEGHSLERMEWPD